MPTNSLPMAFVPRFKSGGEDSRRAGAGGRTGGRRLQGEGSKGRAKRAPEGAAAGGSGSMRALSEEVRREPGSGEPVRRRRGERLRLRVAQHSCRRPVNPFAAVGGVPPVLPPAPDGKRGPSTKKAKIMEGLPRKTRDLARKGPKTWKVPRKTEDLPRRTKKKPGGLLRA